MILQRNEQKQKRITSYKNDIGNIIFLIFLYFLQAIPLGLTGSLTFILSTHKLSYADQGTFSFAFWPFSLKLLWAPLIDSLFNKKFGRRKSWLIPVQYIIGFYMIFFSNYVHELLENDRSSLTHSSNVLLITTIFFVLSFLAATQDIVVDGWALTLLSKENSSWSSTCESAGGTLGWFVGNVLFLVVESAEFSNKYVRPLIGLEEQKYGIITIDKFMTFFGIVFIVTTTLILFFKNETRKSEDMSQNDDYSLLETYKLAFKIAQLPSIKKLIFVLITIRIAFSCESISFLKLIENGVPKEKLGLLTIPLTPLQIILPFLIKKTVQNSDPFKYYTKSYALRLGLILIYAFWVYLTPIFKNSDNSYPTYYFLICILLQGLHSTALYSLHMPLMYFFTKISDKNIGATYLTFLNTVANLSRSWINTSALYMANYLTFKYCKYDHETVNMKLMNETNYENILDELSKNYCSSENDKKICIEKAGGSCEIYLDAYYIQTFICFIFGLVWLIWLKKYLFQLKSLPESSWNIYINKIKLK